MGANNNNTALITKSIENEVTNRISNSQTNINSILHKVVSQVATDIVQESSAEMISKISTINKFHFVGPVVISGNGELNVNQQQDILAKSSAIANLVTNASSLQKLASTAAQKILQDQQNKNSLQQDANQLASIVEKTTKEGGLEGVVKSLANGVNSIVDSITGTGTNVSNTQITDIKNKVNTELTNVTVTESNLTHIIESAVQQSFKQSTSAECKQLINGVNVIDGAGKLTIHDDAIVNWNQVAKIEDLRQCIVNMNLGASVASELGVTSQFLGETYQKIINDLSQKASQQAKVESLSETTSAITTMFVNLVHAIGSIWQGLFHGVSSLWMTSPTFSIMILAVGACIVIGLLVLAFLGKSLSGIMGNGDEPSESFPESESKEQVGGFNMLLESLDSETSLFGGAIENNYGNVYLWALIAILVYYVFGNSLPMSSALVIVIIGYIIYISK